MIPGPPHPTGAPLNYGELFTFADYLSLIEQTAPETSYENALAFFDAHLSKGLFQPFAMTDECDFIYRFVPPNERPVYVVVFEPRGRV